MNFLLLLVNGFLLNVESYSYTPNPRAVHPDGRLPTIIQAKKKVQNIRQKIFSPTIKEDGEDPTLDPTIILVDGNNIRNSFGFQAVSALQLTKKLSCWSRTGGVSHGDCVTGNGTGTGTGVSILEDNNNNNTPLSSASTSSTPRPQVICVWDGGSDVISQRAMSGLTAFSGSVGNADDLIVQCCAFLSQPQICPPRKNRTIVVFTSDANLANRCKLQLMGESSSRIDCQFYHSIYLRLLLGDEDGASTGTCRSSSSSSSSVDTFAPDWEREERRNSVQKLQSFLESVHEVRVDENQEPMNCICEWINNGLGGLKIGRVTKGGSILYQMKD